MQLKVIGRISKRVRMKYRNCKNIEFLGRISDEEKFKVLSNAQGYITLGIEDFGIFPIEAMSCGTPVLFYKKGGICESVIDGKTGVGIPSLMFEDFEDGIKGFADKKWNYKYIAEYSKKFDKERFKREIKNIVDDILNERNE